MPMPCSLFMMKLLFINQHFLRNGCPTTMPSNNNSNKLNSSNSRLSNKLNNKHNSKFNNKVSSNLQWTWGGKDGDVGYYQNTSGTLDISISSADNGTFVLYGISVIE